MESTSSSTWAVERSLEWFGDLGSFSWKVSRAAVARPFEFREIVRQFDEIGAKSVPLVVLAGAAIGTVLALETRSSLVRFGAKSMGLENSTHNIVKQDAMASIKTEGLLGNEYVAISFGSGSAADVVDGGTIASEPPLEMSDLLKKASGILDTSQEALVNVTHTTASLSSISAKIDKGQGTVGALINDRHLYTRLDQTTTGVRDTVVKAQEGVTDFQENM